MSGGEGGVGPRVKICGMGRAEDVRAAADAGAAYVGLVLAESPRRLEPSDAAALARTAREAGVTPVGVVVDREAGEVASLAERVGLAVVQLHGRESPEACAGLREDGREVWKAVRPRSREELEAAADRYGGAVDALLVEGWSPERAGGTGTSFPHAWLEEAEVRRAVGRLVLAGGLDPATVGEAVRRVGPDVVDVSSGVETSPGRKDPGRIRAFVAAVRSAGGPSAGGSSTGTGASSPGVPGGPSPAGGASAGPGRDPGSGDAP